MSTVNHQSDRPSCPRLFSVLGGAVTRASLQQLQRDVDAMVDVSTASPAPRSTTPSSANTKPSTHPLHRLIDILHTARTRAGTEDSTREKSGAAPSQEATLKGPPSPASDACVRDVLIQALGVPAGSALYRECVLAPRRRLQQMVQQLAEAVRARLLPSLSRCGLLAPSESVDLHVQLYPSGTEAGVSATPAALREKGSNSGFCAALTVRRLAALKAEAEAGQQLTERYMGVAASGQTLSSALTFWSDASYGDAPPEALKGYPPLGFEAPTDAASRATLQHSAREEGRQIGRKTSLSARMQGERIGAEEVDPACASVLLGLPSDTRTLSLDEKELASSWVQPDVLSLDDADDGTQTRRASAPSSLPLLTYSPVGLVAVVYVHRSGVAYVAYPPIAPHELVHSAMAHEELSFASVATPVASSTTLPVRMGEEEGETSNRPAARPRVCLLPMLSSTGFTRSLLGLT